jgi:hypothetical protein
VRDVIAVRDPGLDRHEWETEWQALEPLVADSPAEALRELDGLVERMMAAHGYPVDEKREAEAPEGETVKEFLEARASRGSSRRARLWIRATSGPPSPATGTSTTTWPSGTSPDATRPVAAASFGPLVKVSPDLLPEASVSGSGARVCDGTGANV